MWCCLSMLYKVVLKAIEQYFHVVPLIGLCNVEFSD